uniref:E3 ubiquitin ligase complex SCF subunit n=1 Tax=Ditylum brightwellii TaxID=49249 RepID=A0A6V2AFM3_9STRA|mmetsp:Transcript_25139/g.33336  ORF Transcript_25139/g.33336 Transcript_25139/m.33336 type:complete len:174 (+) Transcript_25139:162-683(+)
MISEDDDSYMINLKSKDGVVFEIQSSAAKISVLVVTTIDLDDEDEYDEDRKPTVEIPKVESTCLSKVVDFCNHYMKEPLRPIKTPLEGNSLEEVVTQEWYRNFVSVEQSLLFQLVQAANFMEIQPLLDLACLQVSTILMGKSAEEIRVILNIPRMTAEEEAKARREHRWVFED